jgi:hypothetical protein
VIAMMSPASATSLSIRSRPRWVSTLPTLPLDYNNYVGVIGIGRIKRGKVKPNQQVTIIDSEGKSVGDVQLAQTGDRDDVASFSYVALDTLKTQVGQYFTDLCRSPSWTTTTTLASSASAASNAVK